jgi:hypothetical protein
MSKLFQSKINESFKDYIKNILFKQYDRAKRHLIELDDFTLDEFDREIKNNKDFKNNWGYIENPKKHSFKLNTNIEIYDYYHKLCINSDFRYKNLKLDYPSTYHENSEIQKEILLNIILTVLEDPNLDKINHNGKKGQVWYLFGNAVASYSSHNPFYLISESASKILDEEGIVIDKPISRSKIYNLKNNNKKILTFEHMCPSAQLIEYLISSKENYTQKENKNLKLRVKKLMEDYGLVSVITQDENKIINDKKLRSSLLDDYKDPLLKMINRYEKCNIKLHEKLIPVYGKMYR